VFFSEDGMDFESDAVKVDHKVMHAIDDIFGAIVVQQIVDEQFSAVNVGHYFSFGSL